MSRIALLDACVLYPADIRDFLVRVAMTDAYHARWTERIHDEWIRNLLMNRTDLTKEQLNRTRRLMNLHVRDCLVEDYEHFIESLVLPDPDDRHVLAAAIRAQADVIVTTNLKDFPTDVLSQHRIIALHPDKFVCQLMDSQSGLVCSAARLQRASLKNPVKSVVEFLSGLEQSGLPQTVLRLQAFADLL